MCMCMYVYNMICKSKWLRPSPYISSDLFIYLCISLFIRIMMLLLLVAYVRSQFSETASATSKAPLVKVRRASEPNLRASEPNLRPRLLTSGTQTRNTSQSSSLLHSPMDVSLAATPVGPSPRAVALKASASFDQYQLRSVLQQLLPAEEAKQNVASPVPASRI